jgi:hypothetical protein
MCEREKLQADDETGSTGADPVPEWIATHLQHMFVEVMQEAVPDEFAALLKQLELKEKGRSEK